MSSVEGWPPRHVSPVRDAELSRGDGEQVIDFIETLCKITKDSVGGRTGETITLQPWQRQLIRGIRARRDDGRLKHRQGLIGVARKNGKSSLLSGIALHDLVLGNEGAEIYSVAVDREQARIVFGTARRMVEMEPELAERLTLYRDAIEDKDRGSVYRVLSADAISKEGLNPTTVIFDEVHGQPNRELWDVFSLASGARVDPLMLGITTAGAKTDASGNDSLCYTLYNYGQQIASGEVDDPSFYFAWWEPVHPDADHRVEQTWREANPGFGTLVDAEDFQSAMLRTPEAEFRTKRCNQWVSSANTWLPHGSWDQCIQENVFVPERSEVVIGVDGSWNNDSTAIVAVSIPSEEGEKPVVEVVEVWERPTNATDWQVPIFDVEEAIRECCRRWKVTEIVVDPFRWARTYQLLEGEGLPIVEFPQTPARMMPATQRTYEAVVNDRLVHNGDPRLARHMGNCVLKVDSRGSRITKEQKSSRNRIDLAVSAVMALDRAEFYANSQNLVPELF